MGLPGVSATACAPGMHIKNFSLRYVYHVLRAATTLHYTGRKNLTKEKIIFSSAAGAWGKKKAASAVTCGLSGMK